VTDNVLPFQGTSRDDRQLLTCENCGAATFKIVKRGASDVPFVECSNCESTLTEVKVHV
jgi:uncharacterized Zn finger protein